MNEQVEFDFVTAMTIIAEVEKSSHKGDCRFLKLALGEETFKTMAAAGYIGRGFYICDGKIVDTYKPTPAFYEWGNLIKSIPPTTIKAKIRNFFT